MALNKTTTNAITDQAISSTKIEDGAITSTKISDATTISVSKTTITAVPPTITSLNVSQIDPSAGATVTITGTGFIAIPDVKFMNTTTGVRITPSAIGFTGSTQLTAAFPSGQTVGIYKVIVENPNGLSVLSTATITYSLAPAWATAEGSLGSFEEGDAINLSLLAYDDDSTAVTSYTLQSGSLPSGITLDGDSTIGSITGTAPNVDADTAFNFTIRAADNESQTSDRTFSMTITNWGVDNSLRFNDDSSDNLNKTFGSSGNRKTWTLSTWIKRSTLGANSSIFTCEGLGIAAQKGTIRFDSSDKISAYVLFADSAWHYITSDAVYRDTSAWYHVVVRCDTTQSTNTDRLRLYVNGTLQTLSGSTYPDQNEDTFFNEAEEHQVASLIDETEDFDGYMAEFCWIDGSSLAPDQFGETDATSGIWIPKKNADLSFGTNGFKLKFDNSEALGADSSGNGNNFTVNNLTAIDQTTDTPQNNFATMNPLVRYTANPTFTEGNLSFTGGGGSDFAGALGTFAMTQGKWFWECKILATLTNTLVGVQQVGLNLNTSEPQNITGGTTCFYNNDGGEMKTDGTATTNDYGTFSGTDIMGVAVNMDDKQMSIYKNGSAIISNFALSASSTEVLPFFAMYSSGAIANFGNPSFTIASGNSDANGYGNFEYAVPSGYYALCTKNLAEYG